MQLAPRGASLMGIAARGISRYILQKPFSAVALGAKVREVLDGDGFIRRK